ncbi:MAG: oxidoreductase [Bdellovibrionales bacterium CG12_big_fil_rev_8_21_14_0_65_38_15]|nr:MAG: oxidoreductase [Bdellovibrionales bacterium CG22_combo_CG10-13_8_21_14_all_38_13]PIQ56535.1 MAG: oxidoreductase [Bdellovibrionales bacterium CG12_big_fil_rev_8_21_14_0_65_38_15]PIR30916.1 MAG: oxidoreductase [Bdellovibrionales bacterium CG11_big_fil_rev_8_21_14_0_20_38_13]
MKNFAIIGVGGYIAPRHLEAIKSTGNTLVAAFDPKDSVGILDRYFPDCQFFTEFERFESFIETQKIDYVSICSPNYLHSSHIKFALRNGANAICEKPLVLNESDIDELVEYEKKYNKKVFTILQLRVHDSIVELKNKILTENKEHYQVDLTYLTSRGNWYFESWKGDESKSGGLSTNIGVHFFDMLTWIFGELKEVKIEKKTASLEIGLVELDKATVRWKLSVDRNELPKSAIESGKTTFRSIRINEQEFEFSEGFTELHNKVYERTLSGIGYGLEDARTAIKIVEQLRKSNELY